MRNLLLIKININWVGIFPLTYKSLVSFCGTYANSENPDQTPQNTTSEGLHLLITVCSIKILMKMKNNTQETLKLKWTGSINKIGLFHSARAAENFGLNGFRS